MGLRAGQHPASTRTWTPRPTLHLHGPQDNKFGIAHERTRGHLPAPRGCPTCTWSASTATSARRSPKTPYLDAMDRACWTQVQAVEAAGIAIQHARLRRRLGISYNGDQPPAADVPVGQAAGQAGCARLASAS